MYKLTPEEIKRMDEDNYRRIFEDELIGDQIIIDPSPRPDPDDMKLEDYPAWMHKSILRARANKAERLKREAEAPHKATAAD